jgi:hypothetical protein
MPNEHPASKECYVSFAQVDNCKVCGERHDLRMGACWDCADFVDGEQISPGNHRLWDRRNPRNEWFVSEGGH